ncbi:hypothetical protein T265_13989, partial [Opisthorchis viverrini]
TVICYGQTGAGKTYTISGVAQAYPDRGIIPRALAQLFEEINQLKRHEATVRISYVEIYNEKMADLLQSAVSSTAAESLVISDIGDEVSVKGLFCPQVNSLDDALALLFESKRIQKILNITTIPGTRTVGTHVLNRVSSRAHTIFTVYLTVRSIADGSQTCLRTSRINFVDLAGSERVQKTKSDGRLLKEATFINRSLSFLEQMVLALSDTGRSHVPYRQSKLTHFLKNSVGGKCRTVFIANVWNEDRFLEETISTLRFASRVMRIPCHPAVQEHEDIKMLIKRLRDENILLKQELLMYDTLNNRDRASYGQLTEKQKQQIHQLVAKYLSGKLKELPITSTNQLKEMFDSFRKINRNLQEQLTEQCQVQFKDNTEQVDKPQQPVKEIQRIARNRKNRVADAVAPVLIETPKLGDVDPTSGFGYTARDLTSSVPISITQDSAYLQSRLKERAQPKTMTEGSFGSSTEPTQGQKSKVDEPPTRAQAFEEFQKEAGRELINIFTNNRAILAEQLEKGKIVGSRVNEYKHRLELLQAKRLQLKTQREAQGLVYTDQMEQIITEEEFDLLKQVGELETEFRQQFEEWEAVKQAADGRFESRAACSRSVKITLNGLFLQESSTNNVSVIDRPKNPCIQALASNAQLLTQIIGKQNFNSYNHCTTSTRFLELIVMMMPLSNGVTTAVSQPHWLKVHTCSNSKIGTEFVSLTPNYQNRTRKSKIRHQSRKHMIKLAPPVKQFNIFSWQKKPVLKMSHNGRNMSVPKKPLFNDTYFVTYPNPKMPVTVMGRELEWSFLLLEPFNVDYPWQLGTGNSGRVTCETSILPLI